MKDQRKRSRDYLAGQRAADRTKALRAVVRAARDEGAGVSPRYRATQALLAVAAAEEQVTEVEVARRAACHVRTVRRAKRDLVASQLVNAHAPAPLRDRGGRCVGRDPRGGKLFVAMLSRAAAAVLVAAGLRSPNRTRKTSKTKSGLREGSHLRLPGVVDGKPAVRPVRQNN